MNFSTARLGIKITSLCAIPFQLEVGKCRFLLLAGETVEEVKERNGVFGFFSLGLFCYAVVADLLALDDHGSAVRCLREGENVVVGESDALADLEGDSVVSGAFEARLCIR